MTGHGAKFGRKKEAAIAALLTQRNLEEAARTVNVNAKTLRRWMKLPEFHAEYLQARRDVVMQTHARIQQNSGFAVSLLLKLMADATTPASVRASNARYLLDSGNKSLETESWEGCEVRIAALESARRPEPPVSQSKPKAGPSGEKES
jgi:hypothetical protein